MFTGYTKNIITERLQAEGHWFESSSAHEKSGYFLKEVTAFVLDRHSDTQPDCYVFSVVADVSCGSGVAFTKDTGLITGKIAPLKKVP